MTTTNQHHTIYLHIVYFHANIIIFYSLVSRLIRAGGGRGCNCQCYSKHILQNGR